MWSRRIKGWIDWMAGLGLWYVVLLCKGCVQKFLSHLQACEGWSAGLPQNMRNLLESGMVSDFPPQHSLQIILHWFEKSSCTGLKSCKAQPSKINKLILDWCRLGDAGVRCVCNALAHHVQHLAPEQSKKCGQKEGSHEGVKELPLKPSVRRTPIWLVTDFCRDFPHSHWRWIKKGLRL